MKDEHGGDVQWIFWLGWALGTMTGVIIAALAFWWAVKLGAVT